MKVLVFIEQRGGKIKSSALEALTAGAKLAGSASNCAAVVVGKGVSGLAANLKGYGADTVYVLDHDALANYNSVEYAAALEQAIKGFSANVVVGIAAPMTRDVFPKLAARFDGGILSDVTVLEANGEHVSGVKPMYAGKVLAKVELHDAAVQFVSLRANSLKPNQTGAGQATVSALGFTPVAGNRLKTVEVRKGANEKLDLTEASTIVSGGRALGSADNFKVLQPLADLLGATVGASRAAVDSGYATHDMQVGQTGKTVNPNLYIASGISGSIQHMAGMRTSKVILAVNTDPEAPIFKVASYGIVGDLFQVVPVLTAKLKALLEK